MPVEMNGKTVTNKEAIARGIAEHIIETYSPQDGPCVLMWRETVNGYHAKHSPAAPQWRSDQREVHEHWQRFGKAVAAILRGQYGLTVVNVSSKIRSLVRVKHGGRPDRDDSRRTDENYRQCLPGPGAMTLGVALFPRNTFRDHPLVLASHEQRVRTAATGFRNGMDAVELAKLNGVISDESGQQIEEHVVPIVGRTIKSLPAPIRTD